MRTIFVLLFVFASTMFVYADRRCRTTCPVCAATSRRAGSGCANWRNRGSSLRVRDLGQCTALALAPPDQSDLWNSARRECSTSIPS